MTRVSNTHIFRFLSWSVYQDAQSLFREVLPLTQKLPRELNYSLGDQVRRSALSIVLNIAEGSGRGTDKELNRFFNIAIGSVDETVAALDTLHQNGYIEKASFDAMF